MDTMTSVGKKFANFARGRNAKKKSVEPKDELDVELALRKTSLGTLSPIIGSTTGSSTVKSSKSNSLGSINSDSGDPALDHEDIITLTHNVRSFSDALGKLKAVFPSSEGGLVGEDLRVSAHEKLGEVLFILKTVLQKYPALHNTEVLTSAAVLITKIKSCQYEDPSTEASDVMNYVDQLALAFSSSVSEYLMGDIDSYPILGKTKSYDNLAAPMDDDLMGSGESQDSKDAPVTLTGEEIDKMLLRYESGVDTALQRAKAWAKYAKDIIIYVEKKAHMEYELAKNLQKLANNVRQNITEDSFLPFQSVFCTVLDQDIEFSSTVQATCAIIQSQKFVEPLSARRAEHEKNRKGIKDTWNRELRRMQEAVANVRKAKTLYIQRQQEWEKAKEMAQKAETDSLAQSQSGGQAATKAEVKVEKKKKLVEDALRKAMEAETSYKGCVAEANHRQLELEKVKGEVLCQLRELILASDDVLKNVTVGYFQLLHTVSAPAPLQFQALWESSQQYDAGSQYIEYVKRLPIPPQDGAPIYEPFVFEPYNPDNKMQEPRKPSTQSSGSIGSEALGVPEYSPLIPRLGMDKPAEDSDSDSDVEDSPSSSPYSTRKQPLANSSSLGDLPVTSVGSAPDRLGVVSGMDGVGVTSFRGAALSNSAQTHLFRKLRSPSKCRACETYVYFQGAECERCGLSSHKKCLETLHFECGHRPLQRRMTTFGVDFSAHVQETHTDIPYLVQKCTAEVDTRGINIKGIYRISGVKSRVEKLCQSFEIDEGNVDLSDQHPNVIANVLKLYLRQLPEPLLTFALYRDLINLAKEEQQGMATDILERLTTLIHSLPRPNFRTCGLIMHHLKRVTDHVDINQMSASNLGIVFGPTLLRPSEGAASFDSLLDTPHQTRIIELLILNVQSIFGREEIYRPELAAANPSNQQDMCQTDGGVTASAPASLAPPTQDVAAQVVETPKSPPMSPAGASETRWFIPPEITENLLDELAREEPRFQQVAEGYNVKEEAETKQPASVQLESMQAEHTPVPNTQTPKNDSSKTNKNAPDVEGHTNIEDEDDDDTELSDSLLPDSSSNCQMLPSITLGLAKHHKTACSSSDLDSSSRSKDDMFVGLSQSADSVSLLQAVHKPLAISPSAPTLHSTSPGLRKKLLPSQVLGRPVGGSSVFYTSTQEEYSARVPPLTKPMPFTPPLQRHANTRRKGARHPLTKPGSLDIPIGGATTTESSTDDSLSAQKTNLVPASASGLSKSENDLERTRKRVAPEIQSEQPMHQTENCTESSMIEQSKSPSSKHKLLLTQSPMSSQKNNNNNNLIPVCETRTPEYV